MIVGITGTREGMNDLQREQIRGVLQGLAYNSVDLHFHHGDCVGVDVQAAAIAREFGYTVIGHPPDKDGLRGYYPSDIIHQPKGYFQRNRNIVDSVDVLLVVPKETAVQSRGGTWYTYGYAVKKNKPTSIFYPEIMDE